VLLIRVYFLIHCYPSTFLLNFIIYWSLISCDDVIYKFYCDVVPVECYIFLFFRYILLFR
jgi:hypothetical protein